MDWICINCAKNISPEDFYCPYCHYQQYPDGFNPGGSYRPVKIKKIKVKKMKSKPLFSTAEIITASMKGNDTGYLGFLLSRLL